MFGFYFFFGRQLKEDGMDGAAPPLGLVETWNMPCSLESEGKWVLMPLSNKRDAYFFCTSRRCKQARRCVRVEPSSARHNRVVLTYYKYHPAWFTSRLIAWITFPGVMKPFFGAPVYVRGGLYCKLPHRIQSVADPSSGGAAVPCPHSHIVKVLIQHLELTFGCRDPPPPKPRQHHQPMRQKRTVKSLAVSCCSCCPVLSGPGYTGEPKSQQSPWILVTSGSEKKGSHQTIFHTWSTADRHRRPLGVTEAAAHTWKHQRKPINILCHLIFYDFWGRM